MTTETRSEPVLTLPPLPAMSLGEGVYQWCSEFIRQPDGPDAGEPWRFTREQVRFLHYLYAVDERGRFTWTRAVLRRAKGWGKSPFVAAIALAELCGPVRFDGFDADGDPVGVPASLPWVQIAGVSEKQTVNTMSMVLAMIAESPIVDEYGLDPGLTRIFAAGGGRLEPITASAPTAEGARPTFVVLDETHHWLRANGGHKLAEVIRRNLGKSRDGAARSVETTNAHEPGMESVAERSYEAWQAQVSGRFRGSTILYDSREAPPDTDIQDPDRLAAGLALAYGDSVWVDLERVATEVHDPDTPPSQGRQFYLNQLTAAEDAWLSPFAVDAVKTERRVLFNSTLSDRFDGDEITLFFDGSKSDDATGLVACRLADGHLFTVGVWQKPPGEKGWQAPRGEVDSRVDDVFDRYQVVAFYADPSHVKDDEGERYWDGLVDDWHRRYAHRIDKKLWAVQTGDNRSAFMWDMTSPERQGLFTGAAERFVADVESKLLTHDGHPLLVQHLKNARRRPDKFGVSLGKEHRESAKKIDLAVCAVGARMLYRVVLNLRASQKQRSGKAVFL